MNKKIFHLADEIKNLKATNASLQKIANKNENMKE